MSEGGKRKAKKSETLQVRLPFGMKSRFLDACHRSGTTASEVLRSAISTYLARGERPCSESETGTRDMIIPFVMRRRRVLAAGVGGAVMAGMLALPSAAGPDNLSAFSRLDRDGDGVLTMAEFFAGEQGIDAVARTRQMRREGAPVKEGVVWEAFALKVPRDVDASGVRWGMEVQIGFRELAGVERLVKPEEINLLADEFVGMDVNGDDHVSEEEFRIRFLALMTRGFELLDMDASGYLSQAEFALTPDYDALLDYALNRNNTPPAEAPVTPETGPEILAGFRELDADGDGMASLAEYLATD